MSTATVTTKGQITIPKDIRDALHLESGDRISFILEDGRVVFIPATKDIRTLKGRVPKPKRSVSLDDMQAAIRSRGGKL